MRPTGWTEITPVFLADHSTALSRADLRSFFDGQAPDWRHAAAPDDQIPRRRVVAGGRAHLKFPLGQSMVLIVGADGEGKSTALRQTAVDLVQEGHRVLFRGPGAALDVDAIVALPGAATWILASDDADEIAGDLHEAVTRLHAAGRRDIHWLLTARYEDWTARFRVGPKSVEPAWASTVDLWPEVGGSPRVLGLNLGDSVRVVGAWEAAGCLGALGRVAAAARPEALVEACRGPNGLSAATFVDGTLRLRFGADGLVAHVAELLPRMADDQHRFDGGHTVQDAFLYAAAADVAGVDGVDLHVLADLLGVDRGDRRRILERLGRDGLATGSAGVLRVRHRDLAGAGVVVADELGVDVERVFVELVRGTAETGNDMKGLAAGGAIMTCGPTVAAKLQELGFDEARAYRIARAAADESARVLPDLLMFTLSRARTYRGAGEPGQALAILRAALDDATDRGDWSAVGRSYLYDLGVSEGDAGHIMESIVLAGLSIANVERLGQVSLTEAKQALDRLGEACTRMDGADVDPPFQRLLRACTHLGRKVTPKWDQPARLNFHRYGVLADELGVGQCSDAQAVAALSDAVAAARRHVDDAGLTALWTRLLPDPERPPFGPLTQTVGFALTRTLGSDPD